MKVFGIETSCDETAIALVKGEDEGISVELSKIFSQIETHEEFGGVVPEVAARIHLEKLLPMIAKYIPRDGAGVDAIAVTAGPGLSPALRTGVETAKTLAWLWKKPLVPVSHLEGHIYANWLAENGEQHGSVTENSAPELPALCLIVSGGHTELIVMTDHGTFERIGETLDDAAGEAFDKVANMLELGYPGGPKIEILAKDGKLDAFDFPRGLLDRPDFNFSFSGVKTSVLYTLRKHEERLRDDQFKEDIAASFQEAVVDVLVQKTLHAAEEVGPKSIILAGGVAANKPLRERLQSSFKEIGVPVFVPPFRYSLDNAAMIAAAGYFRAQDAENFTDPLTLKADSNLDF